MKEKEVITNVLAGNTGQFALLVKENNELLYRIGMSYLNSHAEVEDLMQSAYIKAFEHLSRFQYQSSFATWLTRIMINECLMFVRKRKHKLELAGADYESSEVADIPDKSSPEAKLTFKEIKEVSEKMILKLPEDYRIVFILREVQKLSTKEVAGIIGISEENVKVKLLRAKRKLQRMIINYMGDGDVFNYDKKYCNALTRTIMNKIYFQKL